MKKKLIIGTTLVVIMAVALSCHLSRSEKPKDPIDTVSAVSKIDTVAHLKDSIN